MAMVSQSLGRRLLGGESPVGRRVLLGPTDTAGVEIVGVVADAVHSAPRAGAQRTLYYPAAQNVRRLRWMCVAIRTAGEPTVLADRVRQELRAIDPALPVMKIDTVDEQLDAVLFQDRLITNLAVTFGLLAAALAAGGLGATLFYAVARRTKEIGVRVALGASRAVVLRMVLGETFALVLAGIALGLPLTLSTARLLRNSLFGVTPYDPVTIAGAVLTIVSICLLAAAAPARRATRVDPIVALRCD